MEVSVINPVGDLGASKVTKAEDLARSSMKPGSGDLLLATSNIDVE